MTTNDVIIELDNISFGFGQENVVEKVSLKISRGDFLGIVGPNGGGKTTLVKIMLGLLVPQKGRARLFDVDAHAFKERNRIGYVSQKAVNFDPNFPATVFEVVGMGCFQGLGFFKKLTKKHREVIHKVLEFVDMESEKNTPIGQLSGGQQQRVFIAKALVSEPQVLVLDEPTTGIDINVQQKFYTLLKDMNQRLNLTLIMVSHDIGMITTYVNRISCINKRLFFHGPKAEFSSAELSKAYGPDMQSMTHDHEHEH